VPGSIEPNRWYDLKIEVAGARFKCYLDGVLIHDLTDHDRIALPGLAASCVADTQTGDVIVKLVNTTLAAVPAQVNLAGLGPVNPAAVKTVLTGDPRAEDSFARPQNILPVSAPFAVSNSFACDAPASSLTVIRLKTR
jgi:alpha-L-arabinofuranosidase